MQNKALVVIDIQNDITKNYKNIINNINAAIDWAFSNDIHVVYIKHCGDNYDYSPYRKKDKTDLLKIMTVFYDSDAVISNADEKIITNDINACIEKSPYLEGYVCELDGEIAGYTMLAKSYSTEFGGLSIIIEDLYVNEKYRGQKIGETLLNYAVNKYKSSAAIIRLEVESDNARAINLYKKLGFTELPYKQMKIVAKKAAE